MLHALVETVRALPSAAILAGMYGVQVVLYVVPSGSGQAALSLLILVPLGDLVGVTRQDQRPRLPARRRLLEHPDLRTQGYFMAALALAGVPWTRWARFIRPLQLAWLLAGLALLLIAHAIAWR